VAAGYAARYAAAMPSAQAILEALPARYIPGKVSSAVTYYFSVGDQKHTLVLHPDRCELAPGKPPDAQCVVKSDPVVFENLLVHGKAPGPIDLARGRFKTNDVALLLALKDCFRPV
jgi:hypothetical protein